MSALALRLGLRGRIVGGNRSAWWAAAGLRLDGVGPSAVLDFNRDRYALPAGLTAADIPTATVEQLTRLRPATFSECFAFSASSTGARTYIDRDGVMRNDLAADQPRFDWSAGTRRLLLEDTATNLLPRGDPAGYVVGIVGPTGSFPIGWGSAQSAPGTTWEIVGGGTVQGLRYVDVRIFGTPTASNRPLLGLGAISSTSGTTYTASAFLQVVSNPLGATHRFAITGGGSAGWGVGSAIVAGDLRRYSFTGTPSTTGMANVWIDFASVVNGVPLDVTLRIAGVQLETGPIATSYIPTNGSAVTRAAEIPRFSPLVEAIFRRTAATVRAQFQLVRGNTSTNRIIAGKYPVAIIGDSGGNRVNMWNGTASLTANAATTSTAAPSGAVAAWDASGRTITLNGGAPASDDKPLGDRSYVSLSRPDVANASVTQGSGYYDSVTLWPIRGQAASLQEKAVAA